MPISEGMMNFGQQLPGMFNDINQGIAAGDRLNAYTDPNTARQLGSQKGGAIGGTIGTLLSPVIPFAPAIGKFVGGLLGGNAARKKAEMRTANLTGRRDNMMNFYQQDSFNNQVESGQNDVNQNIRNSFRSNVMGV